MQGRKAFEPKAFYTVHLGDLVPEDDFYRNLSAELDLHWLYARTACYYGTEGQESIDPVVFFKICLVGYLNNIDSDRQLLGRCADSLSLRLFLGYDIDEKLPWHSTISRTRQLYGEEVFLELFQQVLKMCVDKGMVRGKRQALDSALVKANASLDSLEEKEVLADAEVWASEFDAGSEYKVAQQKKRKVEQHHRWKAEAYKGMPGHGKKDEGKPDEHGNTIRPKFLSNHTHFSPTDPDARIAVKPGKARDMYYFGQLSVDDGHHVITGAMAAHADQRDSQCLPALLDQTMANLQGNGIQIDQIAADTGYSSGEALSYCRQHDIDAYIPNFGQYKPTREGFWYNEAEDRYECQRGQHAILSYRNTLTDRDNNRMRVYRSQWRVCRKCPLKAACLGTQTSKTIRHSEHKALYDAMHLKMQSDYARKVSRRRSSTVEPVLGTLKNFLGMRRVHTRGLSLANKHVLLAATCYNLKKYLRFAERKVKALVVALERPLQQSGNLYYSFIKAIRGQIPAIRAYQPV